MKNNKLNILVTTLALVGTLSFAVTQLKGQNNPAPATPQAPGGSSPKPKFTKNIAIHKAIAALEDAKHDLEAADHDYGGHRKQALEQIAKTLTELRLALQFADKK